MSVDRKHFEMFKTVFGQADRAVDKFVKAHLKEAITQRDDQNVKAVTLSLATSLISEASELMMLMELTPRHRYELTEMAMYVGELMMLAKRKKIDMAQMVELMGSFMNDLKPRMDARFGPLSEEEDE